MKDQRPRVTIGLPTYNGERYLRPAIRSMLDQDFGDFELLVADNASTDATAAIIEEFAAPDGRGAPPAQRRQPGRGLELQPGRRRGAGRVLHVDGRRRHVRAVVPRDLRRRARPRPDVVLAYTQAVEIDPDGAVIEERGPTNVADLPDVAARYRAVLLDEVYCYAVFGVIRTGVLRSTALIGPFTQSDRVLAGGAGPARPLRRAAGAVLLPPRAPRALDVRVRRRPRSPEVVRHQPRRPTRTLPRWRVGAEYARALRRAGRWLSVGDRSRSAAALLPWAVTNRRVLSRELARTALSRGRDLVDRAAHGRPCPSAEGRRLRRRPGSGPVRTISCAVRRQLAGGAAVRAQAWQYGAAFRPSLVT